MVTLDDAQATSLLADIDAAGVTGPAVDALRTQVNALGSSTEEVPIEFLSPPAIAGQTGVMIITRTTRVVTGLLIDGNGPAPEPCSYRVA